MNSWNHAMGLKPLEVGYSVVLQDRMDHGLLVSMLTSVDISVLLQYINIFTYVKTVISTQSENVRIFLKKSDWSYHRV